MLVLTEWWLYFKTFTNCQRVFLLLGCPFPGYYGENCSLECPQNCQDGYCDVVEGNCFGCTHRYIGPSCQGRCPFHTWYQRWLVLMDIWWHKALCHSEKLSSTRVFLMCTQSWIDRLLLKYRVLFLMHEQQLKQMTTEKKLTVNMNCIYKRVLKPPLAFTKGPLTLTSKKAVCYFLIFVLQTSKNFFLDWPEELYGYKCLQNCSITCGDPGRCDIMTVNCNGGCQVGWTGAMCEKGYHLTINNIHENVHVLKTP